MSGDLPEHIDDVFRNLHFQYENGWSLRVGAVKIIGGMSIRGFSLMFTEVQPRSATQYETHAPAHTSQEMIAALIRSNLELNHASSLNAWDKLQSTGKATGEFA
ncbi:MAG: hypothetical protein ABJA67_18195 [Chthonomonadales bacterium]